MNRNQWRIRGMAVDEAFRGQRVGIKLVDQVILDLKSKKAESVWCNARVSALGFYEKMGFKKEGELFEITGIGPHFIARLVLN